MTTKRRKRSTTALAGKSAPLHRALDQSVQVTVKVEEAAEELSDVNAALQEEVAAGVPIAQVRRALDKSEAVETKVQEAAVDLVAVNEALTEEVAERDALEQRVSQTASELSASRAAEEVAQHRALHDAVTQLPNATLFGDRLSHALEQARRHKWRLAVMFLDLDHFKQVNDTHGHAAGDVLLQTVAQRLDDFVRGGDTVARRGGDEFLILMMEVEDDASVTRFAEALVARLAEETDIGGIKLTVRASVGVAIFPEDAQSAEELLKCADTAMYVAKVGQLGVSRHVTPAPSRGV